ncbi:MAG: prenyltransferase/squalene oxidase repeat-containing protein [Pirellulaceae bacterium]
MKLHRFVLAIGIAIQLALVPLFASAQESKLDREKLKTVVQRGILFLQEKGQDSDDGSFSKQVSPGVTSICVAAMLNNGVNRQHPSVVKGLKYIESFVREDGGIHAEESGLKNYETSLAVLALTAANNDGAYDETINKAVAFLKNLQWDQAEGHDESSSFYGGQGYGSGKRPDASNTGFFIEAMKAAGEDPESEAMQRALTFMSRCQNLQSDHNNAGFALKTTPEDSGGFIYSPANNGESKAGESPDGGLRSYGSMTYTGLKSFLYAGVKGDDIRVQAAKDWIRRHYTLKTNPGMGDQGLYYYYHVFAKALDAAGDSMIEDSDGTAHDWRVDFIEEIASRQLPDGSWVNAADRWYEGDPNLVTAYVLMALSHVTPDTEEGAK